MMGKRKTLGILGAGAFSQQVLDLALDVGAHTSFRFYDDFAVVDRHRVFGKIFDVESDLRAGLCDEIALAIGYHHFDFKERIFTALEGLDRFVTLVHPTSYVSRTASVQRGVLVFPHVNIDTNARMLDGSVALSKCSVTHDSVVGRFSFLSIGVALGGRVVIGDRVFIGINSTITPEVAVGSDSFVGAATMLSKSISPGSKVIGNPFKFAERLRI